jgi:uncharacterized protein (TIGR02145 family)
MYCVNSVIENRGDLEYVEICPAGWRLPTREDWETLFSEFGGEQNGKELRYGGKYDFNALDPGYGTYTIVFSPYPHYFYDFKETYQKSRFFSTTEVADPQHLRWEVWMLNIDRATLSTWTGYTPPNIYVPVRCIKKND